MEKVTKWRVTGTKPTHTKYLQETFKPTLKGCHVVSRHLSAIGIKDRSITLRIINKLTYRDEGKRVIKPEYEYGAFYVWRGVCWVDHSLFKTIMIDMGFDII